MNTLDRKWHSLLQRLKDLGSAVVAYSGGVDSTLLILAVRKALREKVVAVTAFSPLYPAKELTLAKKLAKKIGVKQILLKTSEMSNPTFIANPPDRCFHCKNELFDSIKKIAKARKLRWILDGTNVDDAGDYRPGKKAAGRFGVLHPLAEAGLTKKDIRDLSRRFNLPGWNKPAMACLASRIPYGTKITEKSLQAIGRAEEFLRSLGFTQVRVRHHWPMARIEVLPGEMKMFWQKDLKEKVARFFRKIGYIYVTLDLVGYRTGSMNETLAKKSK